MMEDTPSQDSDTMRSAVGAVSEGESTHNDNRSGITLQEVMARATDGRTLTLTNTLRSMNLEESDEGLGVRFLFAPA